MKANILKYTFVGAVASTLLATVVATSAKERPVQTYSDYVFEPIPSLPVDSPTTKLPYKFKDESVQDPLNYPNEGGMKLKDPANIKKDVVYNPTTGQYEISQKLGNGDYRPPTYMEPEEYMDYQIKKQVRSYWKQKTAAEDVKQASRALIPKLRVGGELFDRIFGGNTIDIRPQGTAELIFGINHNRIDNPALPVNQRSLTTFNFNQRIQLNVVGKIGEKLKLSTNYNTEASFDFENQMKIEYNGLEDEIIKKIEAGNVSLPLTGSLINGSQSLFGVKTQLQFGKLTATTILSQQRGRRSEVEVTGGAQTNRFEINGDNYEANRHYFLAQYFRDRYDTALAKLPVINSGINITKIEVWVTNRSSTVTDLRNVVAFSDLGEDISHVSTFIQPFLFDSVGILPKTNATDLYHLLVNPTTGYIKERNFNTVTAQLSATPLVIARDFERIELARRLNATDYTFNPRLGFISLNQQLNYDEVLAVAFQYTVNGQTYQVGEFSTDGVSAPKPLVLKLLKSTTTYPRMPMWDLMMKNVYSLGAYQVNPQDFRLEVWYNNPATGVDINFLPTGPVSGKPLVQVMNLDRLNVLGDAASDGVFDFIEGVTIFASNGRVFLPQKEPFGDNLGNRIIQADPASGGPFATKYKFQELYDSTKTAALQSPEKNRYKLKGTYKSSGGSEIPLNSVNVPQGSVTVTAGGIRLNENTDYTVDYTLGRVKIINEGILNSGTPIKISLESNSLFSIQSKNLIGTHLDYKFNKDFSLAGTFMWLNERPLTQKVNIGDEPISNVVVGLDGNYRTDAPFLTKLVDKLPFISTKEPSNISANFEVAKLFPGHNSAIGEDGNSYIDDFEGSISRIDLRQPQAWSLASVPQGQPALFPEASLNDSIASGFNRARMNWYVIDPLFLRQTSGLTPSHLTNTNLSNHFTREILETELFPNRQLPSGQPTNTIVLDLAYTPDERGQYNYDVAPTNISQGIAADGKLNNPTSRWGGMMRRVETNDFEATNIEYLQLWMMDPFNSDNIDPNTTGDMYINIGNISEDVLKDSRRSFENGLPVDAGNSTSVPYDETNWGRVPVVQSIVNAFDINESARPFQDVGFDGMRNEDELNFFSQKYLQKIATAYGTTSQAYLNAVKDPSGDDYHFYRGSDYDAQNLSVLDRYKQFNGLEGNSPGTGQPNKEGIVEPYTTSATTIPSTEDINRDQTLSESEGYFQYKVSLRPADFNQVGQNYITNILSTNGQSIKDGTSKPIKWYQMNIPIREFESKVGNIEDFRSIRFIRIFFKGVDKKVVCRLARIEFVRGEWRTYNKTLLGDGEYIGGDDPGTSFSTVAVNYEENGSRTPVNYVIPPGIQRQINVQSANLARLNEQALSLKACNLVDGDARAAFRTTSLDVLMYKRLKMFVHAEAGQNGTPLNNGDLRMFVRLGTDFNENYYEYEIPLSVTAPGNYNGGDENDQYRVWPTANELDLEFAKLQNAKQNRNNSGKSTNLRYMETDGANKIYIKGSPNLGTIKTIMVGVRNPKQQPGDNSDDGLAKCGEVWVNELRLTDFNEDGGWATLGRVNAKLADLGTISFAGNYSAPGWGGIEKRVNERQRSHNYGYDFSSNIELSKFTPSFLNLKIPMFVGYSETFIVPLFNPLDPDINLKNYLDDDRVSQSKRDSVAAATVTYTQRRSINFTNVKKEKGKNSKKSHIYDIENFAFSYSFNEQFNRDVNIEYNTQQTYKAGLTWGYSPKARSIKPFEKTKLNPKYFALIKDINFSPIPSRLGFTADVDRFYSELKNRNNTGSSDVIVLPQFNKRFVMSRNYDLKWDLTKALKLDFTASNLARIMEPQGRIDTQEKRDSVNRSLLSLGETTNYRQTTNVNYTIPINKFPMLDFINATVRYSANYEWIRAPFAADSMGNTINNSNSWQWNGQFNMSTLYNKIPFFKKLAQKPLFKTKQQKEEEEKKKKEEEAKAKKAAASDTSKTKKKEKKKVENQYEVLDYLGRIITSVKNISINYTDNAGTTLPGYKNRTQFIGMDPQFDGPTPGFVFGSQTDIRQEAIQKDWLVKTPFLNIPYATNSTQNLTLRANIEPLPDFKIEINANRNFSKNYNVFFRYSADAKTFVDQSPTEMGTFSMSFLSIATAFEPRTKDLSSPAWNNFLNYRFSVSQFRASAYNLSTLSTIPTTGFYDGYSATSQDVVIPAFLAAYSGRTPTKGDLDLFPAIPLPNWRVTYDGLSKIEFIKKYFKTVTLSHSYRSSYSIGSFAQNLQFVNNGDDLTTVRDAIGNLQSKYIITAISISEQFAPFAKVEMTWNNSLTTTLEYKKERNLSLAMSNIQLQELNSSDIVVGAGYRFKDLKLKFGKKTFKSDMNLRADVSWRNNVTVIRKAVEGVSQATAGQDIITIKTSADYVMNDRLTIRAFYDHIINTPVISTSFPTSNINAGFSLRFTLAQ